MQDTSCSALQAKPRIHLFNVHTLNWPLFFVSDLTLASAEAIILVWLGKVNVFDVHLMKDLRPLAKSLGLKLLRNKDKTTHIRAIASVLLREGKVKTNVALKSIAKDNVQLQK